MAWLAVFNSTTGDLVSVATVVANPLPDGLTSVTLASEPDLKLLVWDKVTRTFLARPAKVMIDRWQDFLTNVNYAGFQTIYNALNAQRKTQIQAILIKFMGSSRFRSVNEPTEVS